jgi:hypothetical protein
MENNGKITVAGKLYQFWKHPVGFDCAYSIRSEDNPFNTPYLKVGGKMYLKVVAAIMAAAIS